MHTRVMATSKRPKRPKDPNERAYQIVQESVVERSFPKTVPIEELPDRAATQPEVESALAEGKNPHAVALGLLGGSKGGKKRAANLSAEQRSEIAKKAARARWGRKKEDRDK